MLNLIVLSFHSLIVDLTTDPCETLKTVQNFKIGPLFLMSERVISGIWLQAMQGVVGFYKENTKILLSSFQKMGFKTFGGMNAPYVWVHFPGQKSWDIFAKILEKTSILTTPGTGFGPSGEGFLRFSAFGRRENVLEACRRLEEMFKWVRHQLFGTIVSMHRTCMSCCSMIVVLLATCVWASVNCVFFGSLNFIIS